MFWIGLFFYLILDCYLVYMVFLNNDYYLCYNSYIHFYDQWNSKLKSFIKLLWMWIYCRPISNSDLKLRPNVATFSVEHETTSRSEQISFDHITECCDSIDNILYFMVLHKNNCIHEGCKNVWLFLVPCNFQILDKVWG